MAFAIVELSLALALATSLILGVLVFRRWIQERNRARRDIQRRALATEYVARLGGAETGAHAEIWPRLRLEAVSHLLQLLRGGERERLLLLADQENLFDEALHAAASKRMARRSEAIRVLDTFGSPRCIQALLELMANDRVMDIRLEAAAALARIGKLPSARDTISLLNLEEQPPIRLHRALFRSIAKEHPEQLRELLANRSAPKLRAVLVDALPFGGDLRDLAALQAAAADPDCEVRAAAMRGARLMGDPRAEPWVVRALSDPEDIVRIQAIQTAAALRFNAALPQLRRLLADPSPWVSVRASEAVVLLGGTGSAAA